MFKPSLKRSQLPQTFPAIQHIPTIRSTIKTEDPSSILIPSKLLIPPANNTKDKSMLVAPLMIQKHQYPCTIKTILQQAQIQNQEIREQNIGIGAYKDVNWLYKSNQLFLWNNDQTSHSITVDHEINCLTMGELSGSCLSNKIKNTYILAVGCQNYVQLYCVQPLTLRTWHSGLRYVLNYSLQVQKVQFVASDQLLIAGQPGCIQLVKYDEQISIRSLQLPLYRKILPATLIMNSGRQILKMMMSKNRIYVLFQQKKVNSWLNNQINKLLEQDSSVVITRFVESYSVAKEGINYFSRIGECDLNKRIRSYNFNGQIPSMKIQSIYIQKQNQEEELGIVTEGGCFITLRNIEQVYFSKDPIYLPKSNQIQQMRFINQKRFDSTSADPQDKKTQKVIDSLGYHSLTLTDNCLMWVGDKRMDVVRNQFIKGDLCLRNQNITKAPLFRQSEFSLFTTQQYFIMKQIPLRHLIVACMHLRCGQIDHNQHSTLQEETYNQLIQRLSLILSPQLLLKTLIQIIISEENRIQINSIVLTLIDKQLKKEKSKDFRDVQHQMKGKCQQIQIIINQRILSKVWNTLFQKQYRQIEINSKSTNFPESSIYWLALHQIYYQIISPIFPFSPSDFKKNRKLIETVYASALSLCSFFQLKHRYETAIRKKSIESSGYKDKIIHGENSNPINDITISESEQLTDLSWVQPSAFESITNRVINQCSLKLQQQMSKTAQTTCRLITLFFSLSDTDVLLPTFKQFISSKQHQQIVRKIIVKKQNFQSIQKLNQQIPQLGLEYDLKFKLWENQHSNDRILLSKIDLKQIASSICSDYFDHTITIFNNRLDLHLKMLLMYESQLLNDKQALLKVHTLKQRNYLNSSLFPQDQLTILNNKRQRLQYELTKVVENQQQTITIAVNKLKSATAQNRIHDGKVVDQFIIDVSNRNTLFNHLSDQLKKAELNDKYCQLEKMRKSNTNKFTNDTHIANNKRSIERELFSMNQFDKQF